MRLIDADAMIKSMLKDAKNLPDDVPHEEALVIATAANYLKGYLQRTQTVDAVPVVRCKNCKNCSQRNDGTFDCELYHTVLINPEGYCSYGEVMLND